MYAENIAGEAMVAMPQRLPRDSIAGGLGSSEAFQRSSMNVTFEISHAPHSRWLPHLKVKAKSLE